MKTIATVVTFNKIDMLKECLESLLHQTQEVDKIIVVDNGSTDGSREYLKEIKNEIIIPIYSERNLGGAGGFNLAIKSAMTYSPDYIWVMDDDTIPNKDSLGNFYDSIAILKGEFGFLSSNVLWVDGTPCLMNIPKVSKDWNSKASIGLIKLDSASFVSMLINSNIIKEIGYPISDFFIWGDDVEYSTRISKLKESYLVSDSIVIHKMNENTEVNIMKENKDRIDRYFYDIRNKFFIARRSGNKAVIKYILKTILLAFKVIFNQNKYKLKKLKIILKGFLYGCVFNPRIEKYEE